jgi:hypothetical protein
VVIKFTRVPDVDCIAVATMSVEGFAPGHRSLDVVVYACPNHEEDAWENWGFSQLWKYRKEYEAQGKKTDHRCGDLVDFREPATETGEPLQSWERDLVKAADEATADVSMPRDPVELEEQMAAESVDEEREAMEPEGQLFPAVLRLDVNGEMAARGELREIRDEVAKRITGWLADDPEGMALDAQTVNMAFNTGAVQEAIDLRGEWYTVVGVHSDHQTMRLKVTKEV